MRLGALTLETKLQKSIRMGITIFKIFIWVGVLSDIRSEIMFYDCPDFVAIKLNF